MKKEALRIEAISECKYYKGQKSCPFGESDVRFRLWDYERAAVDMYLNDKEDMDEYVSEYVLEGFYKKIENPAPLFIMSVLYNRFCHWNCTGDGFVSWFEKNY